MALELTEEHETESGLLGQHISFSNGRKSPGNDPNGGRNIWGSNGIIGKTYETNSPESTIIIGRVGAYCGSVAFEKDQSWVTDNAIKGTVKDSEDEARFWYYKLLSMNLSSYSHGTGQPLINQSILNSIQICIPTKERRKYIAEILGSVDDKIEANSRLLDTLSELAIAEVERLDLFSATPNALLGEIVKFSPKVPKPDTESYKFIDMSVLPTSGAMAGAIGQKETWVGSKFQEGDTLFSRITPCLENGKTAIAMGLGKEPGVGSTEFIVMRPINKGQELFVYGVARNQRFREIAIQKMTGTSGRQRVKWQDLADSPVNSSRIPEFRLGKTEFELMRSLREENISLTLTRDLLIRHLIG